MTKINPTSQYVIQIVDTHTGEVVHQWLPGLAVEKEFETELVNRIRAKGVGVFCDEEHVLTDIQAALRELLYELKASV